MAMDTMTPPVRAAYKALAELRVKAEPRRRIAELVVEDLEGLPVSVVRELAVRDDLECSGYADLIHRLLIRSDVRGIAQRHMHRASVLAIEAASLAMARARLVAEGSDDRVWKSAPGCPEPTPELVAAAKRVATREWTS